jgi:hypothetical protein
MAIFELSPLSIRRLYGNQFLFLPSDKEGEKQALIVEKKAETPNLPVKEAVIPSPILAPPIAPPVIAVEVNTMFNAGQSIDWKGRRNAKIVVILHEKEFRNRFLTNGLRFFISDSGISFDNVNFGIFQENTHSWQTEDMPHLIGILFADVAVEKRLYKSKNKIIYVANSLSSLALDTQLQEDFKRILNEIKEL